MQIHSLGYRTDLFFPRFEGEVLDRGDYIVILTPSNPGFYWGNFLLFPEPPGPGDLERWSALFEQEICAKQEAEHRVFGWDTVTGETGDVQPFLDAGFKLAENVVLAADRVNPPPKVNHEIEIRQIETDEEWQQAVHLQVELRDPEHSYAGYLAFKAAKFARYREMHRAGLGGWFGAYLDGRLVADLGLFVMDGGNGFRIQTPGHLRHAGPPRRPLRL